MIVTVDEVKTHLRIQYDEEDAYLTSLIAQTQAAAEDYCRTQFPDPRARACAAGGFAHGGILL